MTGFPTLHEFVWPAPLPALAALALTAGLIGAGRRLAKRAFPDRAGALEMAAGFVVACAGAAAVVHAVAWSGAGLVWSCRVLGGVLAAIGVLEVARIPAGWRSAREALGGGGRLDRVMLAVAAAAFVGCLAAALGPACEQDVLSYHLGVPVDWLREGRAVARPEWMHSRLVGLGESLNLLGLACGTDAFGAVLQCAGVAVAAVALGAGASDAAGRRLAVALVAACPVVLGLGAIAKPQMLPSAALAVAVALSLRGGGVRLVFGAAAVAFAVASKHSYLLAALPVLVLWARSAGPLPKRGPAFALSALVVLAIAAPPFMRNALWYGDPLSPLLERFSAAPDGEVVEFAAYLRAWGGGRFGAAGVVPASLAPVEGAPVMQTFGLCALLALAGLRARGPWRWAAGAAVAQAALVLALGQPRPRFMLDAWLTLSLAWIGSRAAAPALLPRLALAAQGAAAAVLALTFGALTFAGALTPALRESVMLRFAWRAAACRWIDETLPPEARAVTTMNCAALFPRPHRHWGETAPPTVELAKTWRPPPLHHGFGGTHFVADDDVTRSVVEADMAYDRAARVDRSFPSVARNPLRRAGFDRITVWTYARR